MKNQFIFKQKVLVTVIASALGLHGAAAQAAFDPIQCSIPAGATRAQASTPVHVGPLNPTNGFPEYVTDSHGVSVERCLDPLLCFASPVVPTDPFSVQIGSGVEAFYWGATNNVANAAGTKILTYVAAAESAFLQSGPNGEPINGAQFAFLRLRFTMGVPVDGTYTVTHPYGIDTFQVTGAAGHRDVFFSIDKGLTPNSDVQGAVAPFLVSDPIKNPPPPGYLGDGGAAALPVFAAGSPCGTNYVEVSGVDTLGQKVDFGTNEFTVSSDLFGIQGKLYDGRVQTPLTPTRLSYSRGATATDPGQIDSFAQSIASALVTVEDGSTIPAGSSKIPTPVLLDFSDLYDTFGTLGNIIGAIDSASVPVTSPANLPPIVKMTATDITAANDPTALNLHLVDFVDIAQADYDPALQTLSVTAASSDKLKAPTLTLRDYGSFTAGVATKVVTTLAPPSVVHVDSSAGGSEVAQVRVITAVAPIAPSSVGLVSATSATLTLNWTDNSNNELGFKVYLVNATNGLRTLTATVAANATQATVTGLTAGQAYSFQVDAFNTVGASSSASFSANTLALPVAPTGVITTLSPTITKGVVVNWIDNSTDETSFQILRSTGVGTFTSVATVAANTASYTDTTAAAGTSYRYEVLAARGPDVSAAPVASTSLVTPAAPSSTTAPTFTAVSGTGVTVSWTRSNTTETGYIVYRAPVTAGVVGAFSVVSGATPLGLVTTFTDTTVAANVTYQYRINAIGWANYNPGIDGANSANVLTNTVNLVAPGSLSGVSGNNPALAWTDTSTGESAYRVTRAPYTVNPAGTSTAGASVVVSSTLAANTTAFSDTNPPTKDAVYQYSVNAFNGVTAGPASTVFSVAGALPTANRPNLALAASTVFFAPVTVTWVALSNINVGGYVIERQCTATTNAFQRLLGTCSANAAFTSVTTITSGRATATFTDGSAAHTSTYTYRMRAVSGVGITGITYPTGPTASVTTK